MQKMSPAVTTRTRRGLRLGVLLAGLSLTALAFAAPARADFGIAQFDGQVLDENGAAVTQAGAHPFEASTTIDFNTHAHPLFGVPVPDADVRTIEVDLPPGFVVDPSAMPKCLVPDLTDNFECPMTTQIGVAELRFPVQTERVPVYNLDPPPGSPALLGFSSGPAGPVLLNPTLRTGDDYGITATVRNISQGAALLGNSLTLWGVPGDPRHDTERGECLDTGDPTDTCPVALPLKPLLTNPTACSGPLETTMRADSWPNPGAFQTASFLSHQPPPDETTLIGVDGCDRVPFDPSINVEPHSTVPDAPSGYSVDLTIPQDPSPDGIAQSHLKKAVVRMPEGVTISPSGADGLKEGCSDAQLAITSSADVTCPPTSKIGTLRVETSLLEEPMTGSIYVGTQQPGDPYRIFLVARGPGVIVKLKGSVHADPQTGQLTTTFDNNPQVPFDRLHLEFKGGPRAPLANPPTCGEKTVTSELTPWSGNAPATPSDTFTIDCPGMSGFSPAFSAGTVNPVGGSFSPFVVRIERSDRQQYINGVTVEMPPGLIARLKDVPLCSDAQANAGSCPVETRVGTATVGSGPGSNPFFLQGSVSLTGPYKGAPYGLAVSVRAIAGPFDLGTVVVRQAIFVDPIDAHLTVVSDPLPTILEGIPLRLRSINVDIDRPGFVINPTSCSEKEIRATMSSTLGAVHRVTQRFQVGDCRALPLKPRISLRLTGRRQVSNGKHPGLRAVVRQGAGQANLRKVAVKLPLSLALDPDNARALCEFADGLRVDCPRSSIIGRAVAHTPVLNRPLQGPVYFVKGIRIDPRTGRQIRTLPTLLVPLRGEVAIDLRARSDVRRGKLVNTFETVPDAPVSRFELRLKGGRGGILVVTGRRNLCRGRHIAIVDIDGQNGKRADRRVKMRTPCAKRKAKRGRKARRGTREAKRMSARRTHG